MCASVAPLVRTTVSRTHVVVVGQVWERVDRGGAAWSDKRAHESWSQRSFSDGQHGETSQASKLQVSRGRVVRAERRILRPLGSRHTARNIILPGLKLRKGLTYCLICLCKLAHVPPHRNDVLVVKLYTVEDSYNALGPKRDDGPWTLASPI
jgi:hypothetical protein